jgi:hypothetical protein
MNEETIKDKAIKKEAIPPHLNNCKANDFVFNISRLLQSDFKWSALARR